VLALFVALGGGAYAAFHLPRNSVRSKNIVNGQVRKPDLANGAVAGGKLAPSLTEPRFHGAGLPHDSNENCSSITNHWATFDEGVAGYYRDLSGWVHLQGFVEHCGVVTSPPLHAAARLPPGPA